jgi:hypothetical protein
MAYITFIENIESLVTVGQGDVDVDAPSYAILQHKIDDIFEVVKEYTSIGSKYAMDDKGNSAFDRYALSNDEKNVFRKFLKEAADNVFRQLGYLSKELVNSFLFDDGPVSPAYAAGTTYAIGVYVYYTDGYTYKSLQAANIGHTPSSSPTYWGKQPIDTTIPPYVAAQVYAVDDFVVDVEIIYKSLQAANTGHTPSSSPTYWQVEPIYVDTKGKITITIENLKNFDSRAMEVIDNKIFQIYQKYTLKEWYKLNKNKAEWELTEVEVNQLYADLRALSFRRIQPMYRTGSII